MPGQPKWSPSPQKIRKRKYDYLERRVRSLALGGDSTVMQIRQHKKRTDRMERPYGVWEGRVPRHRYDWQGGTAKRRNETWQTPTHGRVPTHVKPRDSRWKYWTKWMP